MPLEISEIGIHIAVGGAGPSGAPPEHGAGPGPSGEPEGGAALTQAHIDQIVSSCVSQVMRNLRQREER
jgi:hypothetical protein